MLESHTYYLLSRYMNHTITSDELKELRVLVNLSDDEGLWMNLSHLWETYQEPDQKNELVIREMFVNIQKRTKKKRFSLVFNKLIRAAVLLLLPLLSVVSVYFYMNQADQYVGATKLVVQVNRGEKAAVTLPDGTKVRLNSESCLSYTPDFGKKIRKVDLQGEAFFEVTKNAEKPFVVNTGYVDIEVLGTSFDVYSYEQENVIEMTLVSGRIKLISHAAPAHVIYLNPNEKALFDKRSGDFTVQKTDNRFETAWLRGDLVFRSARMSDIVLKLERMYGVAIHLDNTSIANDLFTGSFDSEYIVDVMDILEKHYGFTYAVKGDDIYITP